MENHKKIFAERLKLLRNEKSLSYHELSKAIDSHFSEILRWEKEERVPSMFTLIKLAKFFSVSIDWLVGMTE